VKKGKELTRNNVTKTLKKTSKQNNKRVTSKQQERLWLEEGSIVKTKQ